MKTIKAKAASIAHDFADEGWAALDPLVILALTGVIIQAIRLYLTCKKTPAEALEGFLHPRIRERLRLRRILVDYPLLAQRKVAQRSFFSCLTIAQQFSLEEVTQMFGEADENR